MNNSNELLHKKKLSYAKRGVVWGLIGGLLCGFLTYFEEMGLGMEPFTSMEALGLFAVPVIFGFLQDLSSWVSVLVPNLVNGKGKEYIRTMRTKPALLLVASGIMGGPVAAFSYLAGVHFGGPFYPVVISAAFPVIGAILARLFLKEKINKRTWCGIALCVVGAIVVCYTSDVDVSAYPNFKLGLIFGALAALGWACEGVLSCAGMDFIDPEVANGVRYSVSVVFYLIIGIPLISGLGFKGYSIMLNAIPTTAMIFAFGAGAVEGIGYYFYYKSCNACGSARGETLNTTYTIWSCVICAVAFGAELALPFWIGLVIVIIGGILIAGKPSELLTLRDVE